MSTSIPKQVQSSSSPTIAHKCSDFDLFLQKFRNKVYTNLWGPKIMPMRYVINLFKGLTFIWILFLMSIFNNYCEGMYLYLFLHGTYGIAWLIKDIIFPDATFKQMTSVGSLMVIASLLFIYWLMPVTIASRLTIQQPSQYRMIFCICLYLVGLFLMMGSDYQKTMTLSKKKGLISTGFFARTRNPNYLGQMFIYGSFAICTGYWLSYAIVLSVWCSLFAINMRLKDELSYKNKQGWKEYKQKSYMILPKLFKSDLINIALYAGILVIVCQYCSICDHDHEHQHGFLSHH